MDPANDTMAIVEGQSSRNGMRAADADRERVAEQLRSAHADGRLDLTEYEERVQQAWAARTYGDLDALTVDLPQARPSTRRLVPRCDGPTNGAGRALGGSRSPPGLARA